MSATLPRVDGDNLPAEVIALLNSEDGTAFELALDSMVRQREQSLFRALGLLARDLHGAVRRLGGELAIEGVPGSMADARNYLVEVLEMSAKAAHRSLDLAERMRPEADSLLKNATAMLDFVENQSDPTFVLATQAQTFAAQSISGMDEMVIAQSWQDLSGQRIKKVADFIESVEGSLLELVRLTGALAGNQAQVEIAKVTSQDEADRLLSEFGF